MPFATDESTTDSEWKPNHTILIGIIGGVGPAASARLYNDVVELKHDAKRDSDHVPLLIYNNPQIPNNNEAVIGKGPPSIPALVYTAKALERAGATHIAIPCVTAHVFVEEVARQIDPLPILNMLHLTAENVQAVLSKSSSKTMPHRVGLMGTNGTIQSRVYQKAFQTVAGHNIEVICPQEDSQVVVQSSILRIKAGEHTAVKQDLIQEARNLINGGGAELIILGCTELPLSLTPEVCIRELSVPVVDPMRVLALEIIRMTDQFLDQSAAYKN